MTARFTASCDHERAAEGRRVLDATINQVFGASVTLASVLGREQLSAAAADRLHDVIEELDRAASALRSGVAAFAPPSSPCPPAGRERRRSTRIPQRGIAMTSTAADAGALPRAVVIDLSATGVLAEFSGPVAVTEGQSVVASFEVEREAPLVVGRVRRVAPGPDGHTYVALEFEEGLSSHAWRLVQTLDEDWRACPVG